MALVIHDGEHHEPEFIDQQMITNHDPCNFLDSDIEKLKLKGSFPPGTIFRPFDPNAQADFHSKKWVCFPEYPFTIGVKYPFPPLFKEFFATTELCYSQTMPMVWCVLSVLQTLIDFHDLDLGIPEIAQTYNLRSHGNHYFLFQIKPKRSPLVIRATQNDPKWKGRFFFVARNSLPDGDLISSIWVKKAAIFTDLAPPTSDTEAKLSKFLKIPESDRTFKHPNQVESVGSQESEATMSAYFSLDDIDAETLAKSVPESSKPRIPNLHSKSSKKRKTDEVIDLSDPAAEASKAFESLIKCYYEKDDMINDLKKLGLARAAAHDRDSAELAKVKKKLKETKSLLNKRMAEADTKLEETRKTLVGETKRDTAIPIFEARIKMATDAAANGFDISLWDVDTWKVKLAKLKCQGPEVVVISDAIGGKMPKDNRSKPAKTIKHVSSKAAKPTPEEEVVANEDVTMADPMNEVLNDLAEVAKDEAAVEGDTLGEDGI